MKNLLLACIAAMLTGCAATELNTSWKEPTTQGPVNFKKVVVLVVNSIPFERRAQEDELVSHIKKTTAVAAYTFIPDDQLVDREKVKQAIVQSGADGAVVLRLMEARQETAYIPSSSSYWSGSSWGGAYSPGHTVTNTIIRAEVTLYSVPEGKMLWSGSSTTTDPENARDFALQVARAAENEMRKQGLLK